MSRRKIKTSSSRNRSIHNQTNKLAQTVGIATPCSLAGIPHCERLSSASTFRHLQTQHVWQPCCLFQLCCSRHRSFRGDTNEPWHPATHGGRPMRLTGAVGGGFMKLFEQAFDTNEMVSI